MPSFLLLALLPLPYLFRCQDFHFLSFTVNGFNRLCNYELFIKQKSISYIREISLNLIFYYCFSYINASHIIWPSIRLHLNKVFQVLGYYLCFDFIFPRFGIEWFIHAEASPTTFVNGRHVLSTLTKLKVVPFGIQLFFEVPILSCLGAILLCKSFSHDPC